MTRTAVSGWLASSGCQSVGQVVQAVTSETTPLGARALVAHRDRVHAMSAFECSSVMPSADPLGDCWSTAAAMLNATESPTRSIRPGFGAAGLAGAAVVVGAVVVDEVVGGLVVEGAVVTPAG